MGYQDSNFAQFIPSENWLKLLGTWTAQDASNVISEVRTAGAAVATLYVPIQIPSNAIGLKGSKLISIDVIYKIATAALTNFTTVELEKVTLPATGVAVTGAMVPITLDAGHTSTLRKTIADHTMTLTLTTPVWIADMEAYWLKLTLDCAATSVVTIFGAVAHFIKRD